MRSIKQLYTQLESGELQSTQLVTEAFEQIEKENDRYNIYTSQNKERAFAHAAEIDSKRTNGEKLSPLAGIPFSVKDAFNVQGEETKSAARILEGYISPYTATPIQKLIQEGAIYIGKNNQDAFGFGSSTEHSDYGVVKNPWNDEYVAGGSSGGSAAAVAAGHVPFSIGEDTGGSIRLPASFCGITGLKVTYGRVSRYGAVAFASSLDTVGPMAHSAEDIAYIMNIIAGVDEHDATSLPDEVPDYVAALDEQSDLTGKKIGIIKNLKEQNLDEEVLSVFEQTISTYTKLGAEIVEIEIPYLEQGIGTYYILGPSEASSNLGRYDGIRYGNRQSADTLEELYIKTRGAGFNSEAQRRVMLGTYTLSAGYYDAYFGTAKKVRTVMAQSFSDAFGKVDFIASPVAPVEVFKIGDKTTDPLALWLVDAFTIPVNIAGIPSLALPSGFSKKGLPIGTQLMGPQLSEADLLHAGHAFQSVTDWHTRVPQNI